MFIYKINGMEHCQPNIFHRHMLSIAYACEQYLVYMMILWFIVKVLKKLSIPHALTAEECMQLP